MPSLAANVRAKTAWHAMRPTRPTCAHLPDLRRRLWRRRPPFWSRRWPAPHGRRGSPPGVATDHAQRCGHDEGKVSVPRGHLIGGQQSEDDGDAGGAREETERRRRRDEARVQPPPGSRRVLGEDVLAPAYSPEAESPWGMRSRSRGRGASMPMAACPGRRLIATVEAAMMRIDRDRAHRRPRRSSHVPQSMAPISRRMKETATIPKVAMSCTNSEDSGKKTAPMTVDKPAHAKFHAPRRTESMSLRCPLKDMARP